MLEPPTSQVQKKAGYELAKIHVKGDGKLDCEELRRQGHRGAY